jgi:hypothetical protein
MSVGNGGAAIGLPNSNKITPIGGLVPDTVWPTAGVSFMGDNTGTSYAPIQYWSSNWLGEDVAGPFTVPSCNAGKNLSWVTSGAAPIVVPADGRMTVVAGVAVAAVGAGLTKWFGTPGITIPAGSYFWVETFP